MTIDEIIKKEVENGIKRNLTDEKAKRLLSKVLADHRKVEVILRKEDGSEKSKKFDEIPHKDFEKVLVYISGRINTMLVGPAGSGKTHIATICAEALDIPHYSISVNEQTSKSDFLGYVDAMGNIVKTNFRKAYEEGGMFIVDEIDCANPNILTVINSALSNDFCPFPDGMIKRHDKFFCVTTANTFGEGESVQYIGRNIIDAATKDRFATVMIGYDTDLELRISEPYSKLVAELRKYAEDNVLNIVFSTRAIQRLVALELAKGSKLTIEEIKNCLNLHSIKDSKVDTILKNYENL